MTVLQAYVWNSHLWASHTRLSARATSSSSWRMEANGLVHREVYAEVTPRVEYSLTELGKSLKPILDSMWAWGEEYKSSFTTR